MNQADEDWFKLVQAAIYAVRHDGDPRVVIGRKDIIGTAYPPRGSQRLYRAEWKMKKINAPVSGRKFIAPFALAFS